MHSEGDFSDLNSERSPEGKQVQTGGSLFELRPHPYYRVLVFTTSLAAFSSCFRTATNDELLIAKVSSISRPAMRFGLDLLLERSLSVRKIGWGSLDSYSS